MIRASIVSQRDVEFTVPFEGYSSVFSSNKVFSLETRTPLTWMLGFHGLDRAICCARGVRVY